MLLACDGPCPGLHLLPQIIHHLGGFSCLVLDVPFFGPAELTNLQH